MFRLNPEQLVFVTERHLATLTTLRADGSPHVVPVAFTWDAAAGVARAVAPSSSVKVRNARRTSADGSAPRAALCQVDGGRWITLEGVIEVHEDAAEVADVVVRNTRRYGPLVPEPEAVVLRLRVDRVMASTYMA